MPDEVKKISQRIELSGEKEYNAALSEARRNLKTLRSELKAETAELGANATAQQKNEVKVKNLQKQIREQEKIVKTYTEALKEVKEKYGDNDEAVAKWQIKLNDARTALANMRNGLEGVSTAFKDVDASASMSTVATKSFADSFADLANIGDGISSAVESVFTGVVNTVKDAISELWGMIADTAARANNWTDLASYYGTTADQMERINRAIDWAQGDFGAFTNLMNQLSWGGKGDKISELLGVSDAKYEDKLKYTMAVIDSMQQLYKTDPGKLDDAMEQIFGAKKSQGIMWFVTNMGTVRKNLEEIDKNGYSLGEEGLATMNEAWTTLGKIEGKWNALKDKFAMGFGTVTLDIMTNVNGALDALEKYFNAETPEEREKALDELEANIVGAFETVQKAIEEGLAKLEELAGRLKESDNPAVKAVGNIMQALVDALQWFTEDNMNNVIKALEILAAFWITGKGLSMANKIASVVSNIAVIKAFNAGGGAAGAASGAASGGSTAGTAAAGGAAGKLGALMATPAGLGLSLFAGTSAFAYYMGEQNRKKDWGEYTANEQVMNAMEEIPPIVQALHNATEGLDENGNPLDVDAEESLGMKLFRLYGNEFLKLSPDSNIWGKISELVDTSDGLDQDEIDNILSNWFSAGIFSEDWVDLTKDMYNKVNQMYLNGEYSDTPASWWSQNSGQEGQGWMSRIPGQIQQAMLSGMSRIQVVMDGQKVGNLVLPYVSQGIARDIP